MANILICEDDKLIGRIIERILLADLHKVKLVNDGCMAIQELKENTFELVISDYIMPVNTGIDVINFIRTELKSDVPVLMLSGLSENAHIREAKKLGASDYLLKPFALIKLKRKVNQLLQSHGGIIAKEGSTSEMTSDKRATG